MGTFSAIALVANQDDAHGLGKALERLTPEPNAVGVFEVDEILGYWEVSAFFLEQPNNLQLSLLEVCFSVKFIITKIPSENWVNKVQRDLKPVKEEPFVISSSYYADRIPINKKAIVVEAAMAFGTGHHPTTLLCLRAAGLLDKIKYKPKSIADIGCGTGILSIAAVKLFGAQVFASDIDNIAVKTAKQNIKVNGLDHSIKIFEANAFYHYSFDLKRPFDLIFANILAVPLKRLALSFKRNTKVGGFIILSGILKRQANTVESLYFCNGYIRVKKIELGEWVCLIMKNFCRYGGKNKL